MGGGQSIQTVPQLQAALRPRLEEFQGFINNVTRPNFGNYARALEIYNDLSNQSENLEGLVLNEARRILAQMDAALDGAKNTLVGHMRGLRAELASASRDRAAAIRDLFERIQGAGLPAAILREINEDPNGDEEDTDEDEYEDAVEAPAAPVRRVQALTPESYRRARAASLRETIGADMRRLQELAARMPARAAAAVKRSPVAGSSPVVGGSPFPSGSPAVLHRAGIMRNGKLVLASPSPKRASPKRKSPRKKGSPKRASPRKASPKRASSPRKRALPALQVARGPYDLKMGITFMEMKNMLGFLKIPKKGTADYRRLKSWYDLQN